jgi:hypothetical protein
VFMVGFSTFAGEVMRRVMVFEKGGEEATG